MANNITIKDGVGTSRTVASTDLSDVHYPKHTVADSRGYVALVDATTATLGVVDILDRAINEQNAYHLSGSTTLADAGVYRLGMTTPNTTTKAHMELQVLHSGICTVIVKEASTYTGGNSFTPVNRRRDSSNTAELAVAFGVTESTAGSTFTTLHASENLGYGGRPIKWVLKTNTAYQIKITSGAADNIINWRLDWHELVDAN